MAKLTTKIEEALKDAYQSVKFNPPEPTRIESDEAMSFPKLLDFTFPEEDPDSLKVAQVGEVIYVGDGVCHITGLDKVRMEDVVQIQTKNTMELALVLGLQEDHIETVVLGDYSAIKRGDQVRATGNKLRIPVGKELLGRVINPLGEPVDGKGPIHSKFHRDVEFPAPGVIDRVPIVTPMHTGLMVIDSTIPIGRGQRELVIGDRKTGKTRTMIDTICNQKGQNVFCIYVGIGLQAAKAKATAQMLEARGAFEYTTMVVSHSDDPPTLQYMAPYVGAAIGEFYMYGGKHALIVYDDLSKQAKSYRQVSLLLKRSPGRDAYPGDIFFLHSRLLERAAILSPKLGGGSLTALPIAETQGGDVSDYIITNLMSITDGHILLDANLMHEGIMPAVNSGASVSRIGGKVQFKMLQKVGELAGRIAARYMEVKSYETINTEVSEETMRDIKRGKRIKEIFAQDSKFNLSATEEVIILALACSSRMDPWELFQVDVFKEQFVDYLRQLDTKDLDAKILKEKNIDAIDPQLDTIFISFCRQYKLPTPAV